MANVSEILTIALILGSLAIWGIVLERLVGREPLVACRAPVTRPRPWLAVVIVGIWVTFSLSSAILEGEQQKLPHIELGRAIRATLGIILQQAVFTMAMILTLTGLGVRSLSRYGVDASHLRKKVCWGVSGYLAAIVPVIVVNLAMAGFHTDENRHPYLQLLAQQNSGLLLVTLSLSAVLMAPLEEELMYRVILQGSLQRVVGPWVAIPLSAAIFSAVHGFPDMVSLFPLALVLGFLYWRTGSYLVAVTAHALFNAVNIVMAILSLPLQNS